MFSVNRLYLIFICTLLACLHAFSQETKPVRRDSSKQFGHSISIDFRPAFVIPSSPFLKGANQLNQPIRNALSGHLKYAFSFPDGTRGYRVFSDTYQGVGIAYFDFKTPSELGTPLAAYLFQRSRILQINRRLSFDYEWNFGLSTGWQPYHHEHNPNNIIIGSRMNAYMNIGVYLKYRLPYPIALAAGVDVTHFSNGNTNFPNAGLNTAGLKVGMIYDFQTPLRNDVSGKTANTSQEDFPKHISYDLVVFGSQRRKGVAFFGKQVPSPYRYPVLGAYFAPMYNFGYKFRAGPSLDLIYDGSANVYTRDFIVGTDQEFFVPTLDRQIAAGLSARGEYITPIFTISAGLGANLLHKGGDLRGTYQTLALKVRTSRSSFLHIGYNLKDFHEPNYLMLGAGYRFHNLTPSLLSR